jgi:hypothetical protein
MERFAQPVRTLKDITNRLVRREIPMSPDRVNGLFAHVAGVVQQMLDDVRDEIDKNLRSLKNAGASPNVLELLHKFEDVQRHITDGISNFGDILKQTRDAGELERKQPQIDMVVAGFQKAVNDLAMLTVNTSSPAMLAPPRTPLPPASSQAFEAMRAAVAALSRYYDSRAHADLRDCDEHLQNAREAVAELLTTPESAPAPEAALPGGG